MIDNGCEKCAQIPEGICPDCEIEQLEADIGRSMNRIEEIKQKKERKLQCQSSVISDNRNI